MRGFRILLFVLKPSPQPICQLYQTKSGYVDRTFTWKLRRLNNNAVIRFKRSLRYIVQLLVAMVFLSKSIVPILIHILVPQKLVFICCNALQVSSYGTCAFSAGIGCSETTLLRTPQCRFSIRQPGG